MPTEVRNIPADALRFDAPLEFEVGDLREDPLRVPIRILARSGEAVEHPFWGLIAHDLSGMTPRKPRIQIDWRHIHGDAIGVATEFDTSSGDLFIEGELVSTQEDDLAGQIIRKGQAGIPYEASIDFNGPGLVLEEIGPGATAQVNGRTITGPAVIVREWQLRSVAVVPFGADDQTDSEFADEQQNVRVTFHTKDEPMATKLGAAVDGRIKELATDERTSDAILKELADADGGKPEDVRSFLDTKQERVAKPRLYQFAEVLDVPVSTLTKAAKEDGAEITEKPAELESEPPASGPPAGDDARSKFNAELKRFTDAFGGENGAKWFADGKTYEEALELHAKQLTAQLESEQKEKQELSERLQSLDRGEETPVETGGSEGGAGKDKRTQEFEHKVGGPLARFAAGIRLPDRRTNEQN